MRLPVHIWIREENASPDEIAGYFTEIAQRLDGHPQKMRLVVESTVPVSLDFDPADGRPVVFAGGAMRKFDMRRRWLPEHPVPLEFGPSPVVLLIDPIDGNRFRVCSGRMIHLPNWSYALLSAAATLAAVTLHPAAVVATLLVSGAMVAVAVRKRLRMRNS